MLKVFKVRALGALSILLLLNFTGEGSICAATTNKNIALSDLKQGEIVSGFSADAIYLNGLNKPFGARFIHQRSGFIFDLLQIQSVPQAFIWVNTPVTTDSGVAHTQEHLLLGKGNMGRNQATRNQMSLVTESAGTAQWRTFYHFNTSAGAEVFFTLLHQYFDLLLNPDYTDEEIRREVQNYAVKQDSKTKLLSLEEKGTVYNEMRSNVRDSNRILWTEMNQSLYGKGHPLACVSGGTPEGIRGLRPSEIRSFHAARYVLPNMGMVCAFPKEIPLSEILSKVDKTLDDFQKAPLSAPRKNETPDFPPPKTIAAGSIRIVGFPDKNEQKPGSLQFVWPPQLTLSLKDNLLLTFFLGSIAGDADTPLYKLFVASKTLKVDSGATAISASVSDEQGFPVMIGLSDIAQSHVNEKDIANFRSLIIAEIAKIANMKDGSAELAEFNSKMQSRVTSSKRAYADFVNKPPSFGHRHNSGHFMTHLLMLNTEPSFDRSVTLNPEFENVEQLLKTKTNFWKAYIDKWHLLDTEPIAIATRPDPTLVSKDEKETEARLQTETDRLKKAYATTDDQVALHKYKEEYDANTAKLEDLANNGTVVAKFVDSPPLTLDDSLETKVSTLPGGIPLVSAYFDSMTSSQFTLALRLDSVAEDDLLYLGLLPHLLIRAGVIENGKPVSYEQAAEKQRQQIFYLGAHNSTNPKSGRYELKVFGSGTNDEESKRALDWMKLSLEHPYWKTENLYRLRDLVEHSLSSLRRIRDSAYEETWDTTVSLSYRRQDSPLLLNTTSFLTETHNAQRLRWLLKGDAERSSVESFVGFMHQLTSIAEYNDRVKLKTMLEALSKQTMVPNTALSQINALVDAYDKLPAEAKSLVADAADDLNQDLYDIPDQSLKKDWAALCSEIIADVQVPPAQTLAHLDKLRLQLLKKGGARMIAVGSPDSLNKLTGSMGELLSCLSDEPFKAHTYSTERQVTTRMQDRLGMSEEQRKNARPVFAAFVNSNTHQGVVINSAPAVDYTALDDKSLEGALALSLYGGGGAHSLFMKTWGAGLAYGNGIGWTPNSRIVYSADKMPSIPETLRFVASELKKAKPDPRLVEYVVAQNFSSNAGDSFESRGESFADNLADKVTPDMVRNYRLAILKIRHKDGLIDALYSRLLPECGKVIPGLGVKAEDVPDGYFLAISDEKQLAIYEDYLKSIEGPDTHLYRFWGRDFWVNSVSSFTPSAEQAK